MGAVPYIENGDETMIPADYAKDYDGIGSLAWLRERFPDKDWHRHRRSDGRFDACDGTPSDCAEKARYR